MNGVHGPAPFDSPSDGNRPQVAREGSKWRRGVVWGAALIALAGVFAAYLNPHFAVQIANAVWACF